MDAWWRRRASSKQRYLTLFVLWRCRQARFDRQRRHTKSSTSLKVSILDESLFQSVVIVFWMYIAVESVFLGPRAWTFSWMDWNSFGWRYNVAVDWCRLSFTENNAISVLENSQAPWSRISWSRTCRQAPQTSRRSWSCWWSTSPSVRYVMFLCPLQLNLQFSGPTLINTILVTSVKLVCVISTSPATKTGARSSTLTSYGVSCLRSKRRGWLNTRILSPSLTPWDMDTEKSWATECQSLSWLLSRLLTVFLWFLVYQNYLVSWRRDLYRQKQSMYLYFTLRCAVVTGDAIGPKLRKLAVLCHWSLKVFPITCLSYHAVRTEESFHNIWGISFSFVFLWHMNQAPWTILRLHWSGLDTVHLRKRKLGSA